MALEGSVLSREYGLQLIKAKPTVIGIGKLLIIVNKETRAC